MIRVNLAGVPRKKAAMAAAKPAGPSNFLPIVHLLILVAVALGGFYWYTSLTGEQSSLAEQIRVQEEEQRKLAAIIKQDEIYEARKAALESRIRVIDGLKRNQLNPVIVLDMLSTAVERTSYVWLSTFSQNNNTFSMSGTGTSVEALTDLLRNLESTGYFHNINFQRFQDARGNYTFSLTCEFAPPAPQPPAGEKGAN